MKTFVNRIVIALVIAALTGVLAFAKAKKESVTFPNNVTINGTLVKRGTYEAEFNEQTNELSILKGSKVVAKTSARLEKRDSKAKDTQISWASNQDNTQKLLSITFGGSDQNIVVAEPAGQAPANQ